MRISDWSSDVCSSDLGQPRIVTAAMLVIGNEILSGRTRDANAYFLAGRLTELGIRLREVRVVPDVEATIIAAVNALRTTYDYVFTSGGIRSEERRVGKECVSTGRSRWSPDP